MGAWGYQAFENDDALDWIAELEAAGNPSALATAFGDISDEDSAYVEAPEASRALAAAEVVAALRGRLAPTLPQEVLVWLATQPQTDPRMVSEALRAVTRILANSELREVWEESDDFASWKASVEDLLQRLA